MRMDKNSEVVSQFLAALKRTMEPGEVGSDSNRIFVPLDSTKNLELRLTIRKALQARIFGGAGKGLQLDTAATFELKKAAWSGGQVTNDEARFLLAVAMDVKNFESDKAGALTKEGKLARFDLIRFAHANLADIDPAVLRVTGLAEKEAAAARASNAEVMMEWRDGALGQLTRTGEASEVAVQDARKFAVNVRATASVTPVAQDATATDILAIFLRQTTEIGGWKWLDQIPPGEAFPLLIKPGINLGLNRYPTVSSWESVYASALGTLEKAQEKGKNVPVTIADESGIENKDFRRPDGTIGRTTMDNMEHTYIFGAGIMAGIENAYRKEGLSHPDAHAAALKEVQTAMIARGAKYPDEKDRKLPPNAKIEDLVPLINRNDAALIARALKGGVEVTPLDEGPTVILKPVIAGPGYKRKEGEAPMSEEQFNRLEHFKTGIRVNAKVLKFKKMINLPKPPGRHGIMSNCGLTGATKNHIGLLAGVDRGTVLHNKFARVPKAREGEDYGTFAQRIEQAVLWMGDGAVNIEDLKREGKLTPAKMGGYNWEAHYDEMVSTGEEWIKHLNSESQKLADRGHGEQAGGPGQQFFDKLGELEMYFAPMTAFTWTDIRQTVSSFGPDFGEKVPVGVAIASDKGAVVDAYATAALKQVYDHTRKQAGEGVDLAKEFEELRGMTDASAVDQFRAMFKARMNKTGSEAYEAITANRFLTQGRPERLKSWVGAMRMGLAPTDMSKVVLKSGHNLIDREYLGEQTPGPR